MEIASKCLPSVSSEDLEGLQLLLLLGANRHVPSKEGLFDEYLFLESSSYCLNLGDTVDERAAIEAVNGYEIMSLFAVYTSHGLSFRGNPPYASDERIRFFPFNHKDVWHSSAVAYPYETVLPFSSVGPFPFILTDDLPSFFDFENFEDYLDAGRIIMNMFIGHFDGIPPFRKTVSVQYSLPSPFQEYTIGRADSV
jgi:hypothetical protein